MCVWDCCVLASSECAAHLLTARWKYSDTIAAEPFKLMVLLLRTAVAMVAALLWLMPLPMLTNDMEDPKMQMSSLAGRSRWGLTLIKAAGRKEKREGQQERDKRVLISLLRLLDVEAGLPLASFATVGFENCYFWEWSGVATTSPCSPSIATLMCSRTSITACRRS